MEWCHHGVGAAEENRPPKSAVVAAMQPAKRQVMACFERYKHPGTIAASIDVAADGTIANVRADGDAGADTGRCVEEAVRPVRMPANDAPYSLCYPYVLR